MIETLLQYHADPNLADNPEVGCNTPMHLATQNNMVEIMELFLQSGGDDTIQNSHEFTCLHIAAKAGFTELCKLLIEKGKDPECNALDKYGFSASYWAKENGHSEICKLLPSVKK